MQALLEKPAAVSNTRPSYTATLISSVQAFEALEPEWNAFLKRSGIENICLQYEWVQTFLKHYPQDRLAFVTVRDEDRQIIGIAPLAINRGNMRLFQRSLNFLRFLGSKEFIYDWMAFPIHPDADSKAVLESITDALFRIRHQWDVLDLQACLDKSQLEQLSDILSKKKGHIELEEGEAMPELPLPDSIEEYDADKRKKRIHRDTKRFHKKWQETFGEPIEIEHLYPSKETEAHMDLFFEQHAQYWTEKFGKSNFNIYPQLSQFYKDIFNLPIKDTSAPCMTFSRLVSGDKTLAYQFGVWYQWGFMNYICSYAPEYKDYRVGILHVDELIRQCIEWRRPAYSFGQGEEVYKELWSENKKPLWYFRYFRTGWARNCWQADLSLKAFIIRVKSKQNETPAQNENTPNENPDI